MNTPYTEYRLSPRKAAERIIKRTVKRTHVDGRIEEGEIVEAEKIVKGAVDFEFKRFDRVFMWWYEICMGNIICEQVVRKTDIKNPSAVLGMLRREIVEHWASNTVPIFFKKPYKVDGRGYLRIDLRYLEDMGVTMSNMDLGALINNQTGKNWSPEFGIDFSVFLNEEMANETVELRFEGM